MSVTAREVCVWSLRYGDQTQKIVIPEIFHLVGTSFGPLEENSLKM